MIHLERYSNSFPTFVSQGLAVRSYVKQNGEWIADGNSDSETVYRYRTAAHAIKEVRRLARLGAETYNPHVVKDNKETVGLATICLRGGVQHPGMREPTTGADLDYNLTEHASDERHLGVVRALLYKAGVYRQDSHPSAFAVVPEQYVDNRLRGFELAVEYGYMHRVQGPTSLTVPDEYTHEYIDFAKGGQPSQLYYAPQLPGLHQTYLI